MFLTPAGTVYAREETEQILSDEANAISTGYYKIARALDQNEVFDVTDGSQEKGALLQTYLSNDSPAQCFYVENLGGGVYTMENVKSGKFLDLVKVPAANGTGIQQAEFSGTDTQKWKITADAKTGSYVIRPFSNKDLVLQAGNGAIAISRAIGSSVHLSKKNGSGLQQWKFISIDKADDSLNTYVSVSDGIYTISCSGDKGKTLDIAGGSSEEKANADIYTANSSNAQKFIIKSAGNGWYTIASVQSGKLLEASSLGTPDGAIVRQAKSSGNASQKWRFILNLDGSYCIESAAGTYVLDAAGGSLENGTNADIYKQNRTDAQKWILTPTIPSAPADGDYVIRSASEPGKCLNVKNASSDLAAEIDLFAENGTAAQNFMLKSAGSGYYKITCLVSNYVLAQKKADTASSYAWQYLDQNKDTQLWKAAATGDADGSFYLTNKASGLNLTAGGSTKFILNRTSAVHLPSSSQLQKAYAAAPGQRTVLSLLQNAIKPVGRTLYVFDGGWNNNPAAGTVDAGLIGYQDSWWNFFTQHAASGYDHTPYTNWFGCGLDCSGYVQWATYNTFYNEESPYTLARSFDIAPDYIRNGWAKGTDEIRPGDIVSIDEGGDSGHVYIALGTCPDGSVIFMHSTLVPSTATQGEGVQISGTSVPGAGTDGVTCDSEAAILAKQYMAKYFPEWPFAAVEEPSDTYISGNVVKATWITDGTGILTDEAGIQNLTGEEVMKILLGDGS